MHRIGDDGLSMVIGHVKVTHGVIPVTRRITLQMKQPLGFCVFIPSPVISWYDMWHKFRVYVTDTNTTISVPRHLAKYRYTDTVYRNRFEQL